jgi:type VI secretion system secreted protein Hcp
MADVLLLEITGIKGNSDLKSHTDQIILLSYSHGVSLPMQHDRANKERTAGRPVFSEMSFSKMTSLATPLLYAACAHYGRNEDGKFMSVMEMVLGDAMISSINTSGGGGIPSDSFSINYTWITTAFTQQNKDSTKKGDAPFGWDLALNIAK